MSPKKESSKDKKVASANRLVNHALGGLMEAPTLDIRGKSALNKKKTADQNT